MDSYMYSDWIHPYVQNGLMHGFKKDSKEVIPGLRTDSEWINTWTHIGFIMD